VSIGAVLGGTARWALERGEAYALLRGMPDACVDAVITDPPYSSGGQFRGDRMQGTGVKYTNSDTQVERPEFHGDNRDQRSFLAWATLWLSECLRVARPGAPLVVFSDWRQLPIMTDAIQAGGWVWRGIAPWDKTEASRPRMGFFRAQCEYMVWGTAGATNDERDQAVGVLPGCFRHGVLQADKFHPTGKPTALLLDVVRVAVGGGLVLDPFAGSGTTLVAALRTGRRAIGFELSAEYSALASERCAAEDTGKDWRRPEQGALFPGANGFRKEQEHGSRALQGASGGVVAPEETSDTTPTVEPPEDPAPAGGPHDNASGGSRTPAGAGVIEAPR
jgi:site-specific DNA-methyltransferase (adenine-specific)